MRLSVLILLVLAALVWIGVPRLIYFFELSCGEDLFHTDTARSEEVLERAASRDDDPWARILLARLHMARGELEAAAEDLELASSGVSERDAANHLVILNEIGKLDLLRGDPEAALRNFEASLEIVDGLIAQPGEHSVWAEDQAIGTLNIARALKAIGEYEEALAWARRSLEQRRSLTGLPSPSEP